MGPAPSKYNGEWKDANGVHNGKRPLTSTRSPPPMKEHIDSLIVACITDSSRETGSDEVTSSNDKQKSSALPLLKQMYVANQKPDPDIGSLNKETKPDSCGSFSRIVVNNNTECNYQIATNTDNTESVPALPTNTHNTQCNHQSAPNTHIKLQTLIDHLLESSIISPQTTATQPSKNSENQTYHVSDSLFKNINDHSSKTGGRDEPLISCDDGISSSNNSSYKHSVIKPAGKSSTQLDHRSMDNDHSTRNLNKTYNISEIIDRVIKEQADLQTDVGTEAKNSKIINSLVESNTCLSKQSFRNKNKDSSKDCIKLETKNILSNSIKKGESKVLPHKRSESTKSKRLSDECVSKFVDNEIHSRGSQTDHTTSNCPEFVSASQYRPEYCNRIPALTNLHALSVSSEQSMKSETVSHDSRQRGDGLCMRQCLFHPSVNYEADKAHFVHPSQSFVASYACVPHVQLVLDGQSHPPHHHSGLTLPRIYHPALPPIYDQNAYPVPVYHSPIKYNKAPHIPLYQHSQQDGFSSLGACHAFHPYRRQIPVDTVPYQSSKVNVSIGAEENLRPCIKPQHPSIMASSDVAHNVRNAKEMAQIYPVNQTYFKRSHSSSPHHIAVTYRQQYAPSQDFANKKVPAPLDQRLDQNVESIQTRTNVKSIELLGTGDKVTCVRERSLSDDPCVKRIHALNYPQIPENKPTKSESNDHMLARSKFNQSQCISNQQQDMYAEKYDKQNGEEKSSCNSLEDMKKLSSRMFDMNYSNPESSRHHLDARYRIDAIPTTHDVRQTPTTDNLRQHSTTATSYDLDKDSLSKDFGGSESAKTASHNDPQAKVSSECRISDDSHIIYTSNIYKHSLNVKSEPSHLSGLTKDASLHMFQNENVLICQYCQRIFQCGDIDVFTSHCRSHIQANIAADSEELSSITYERLHPSTISDKDVTKSSVNQSKATKKPKNSRSIGIRNSSTDADTSTINQTPTDSCQSYAKYCHKKFRAVKLRSTTNDCFPSAKKFKPSLTESENETLNVKTIETVSLDQDNLKKRDALDIYSNQSRECVVDVGQQYDGLSLDTCTWDRVTRSKSANFKSLTGNVP